jgi:hypothetical protein
VIGPFGGAFLIPRPLAVVDYCQGIGGAHNDLVTYNLEHWRVTYAGAFLVARDGKDRVDAIVDDLSVEVKW